MQLTCLAQPAWVAAVLLFAAGCAVSPTVRTSTPPRVTADGAVILDPFADADMLATQQKLPVELLTPPEVEKESPPVYPAQLSRESVDGRVSFAFMVDVNGRARDLRLREATRSEFVEPAVAAVLATVFKPARRGDQAVPAEMSYTVFFCAPAVAAAPPEDHPAEELDEPPRPIYRMAPAYPLALRLARVKGQAVIDFIVDTEGHVQNVRVISATHVEFAEAAAFAVREWLFKPGRKNGRAENTHMQVPLVFNLE
jgi:TonB family protein